jgi:hypothetical protein
MSPAIDDVVKIGQIVTIFVLPVVLGYPPMSIVVGQASLLALMVTN